MGLSAVHASSVSVRLLTVLEHSDRLHDQIVELLWGDRSVTIIHVERAEKLIRRLHSEELEN